MKCSLQIVVLLAVTSSPTMLTATPTVKLLTPPPGDYHIEQLWKARVNNDDNTTYEAWFEGYVFEEIQGQVFYARTRKFQLPPGRRTYMYRDVQIEHTDYAAGYGWFAGVAGVLPAGNYTFVLLLNPFGGDTVEIHVRPMGPPRLVRPRPDDTVSAPCPQFVWTPPRPTPIGVTYEVKIAEVLRGQTPEEALQANLLWFDQADLRVPSLTYPPSAHALTDGGQYAWQVTATTADGGIARSEVWAFTFGPAVPDTNRCECRIDSVLVAGVRVKFGDTVSATGIKTIEFFGGCIGSGCQVQQFELQVQDAATGAVLTHQTDSCSGAEVEFAFDYNFEAKLKSSTYVVTWGLVCARTGSRVKTECSQSFYVLVPRLAEERHDEKPHDEQ